MASVLVFYSQDKSSRHALTSSYKLLQDVVFDSRQEMAIYLNSAFKRF